MSLEVELAAVVTAVTAGTPRVLMVGEPGSAVLPTGRLDPARDRTLELALRCEVRERTGLDLGYVEQLYTFGNRDRHPDERTAGTRRLAVAYLALLREAAPAAGSGAAWRGWYDHFPWEDWRAGRPEVLDAAILPGLDAWARAAGDRAGALVRRERVGICFGLGAPWDGERVLDRYELLFEAGLAGDPRLGAQLGLDHRRILASALGRLRGKLRYRPVVFELLPRTFTLLDLQATVEALAGRKLHKQNFRRLVEGGGLVEGTGRFAGGRVGRPAELFRFRREVLRERPAPGVGLPWLRTHG